MLEKSDAREKALRKELDEHTGRFVDESIVDQLTQAESSVKRNELMVKVLIISTANLIFLVCQARAQITLDWRNFQCKPDSHFNYQFVGKYFKTHQFLVNLCAVLLFELVKNQQTSMFRYLIRKAGIYMSKSNLMHHLVDP